MKDKLVNNLLLISLLIIFIFVLTMEAFCLRETRVYKISEVLLLIPVIFALILQGRRDPDNLFRVLNYCSAIAIGLFAIYLFYTAIRP
jgi:hypothetical protein